ncbi:MAG: TIGR00296 family protein [Candidatus Marsarchaeota archaeon]|nr:TIGR00296 family protein [Candidatus Marsarchaeota archaeon]
MHIYTLQEGRKLVNAARAAIELRIKNPMFKPDIVESSISEFDEKTGVFVTIEHYPTKTLRGCIGFIKSEEPLKKTLVQASLAAAFEDPRFVRISGPELDESTIEVSILSKLEIVDDGEKTRLEAIRAGRDGTLIEYGSYSGLLLPIVAVERKWDSRRLLDETCAKAGLPKEYWKQKNVKLYKFQTQIFREDAPNGKIIEIRL